MVCYKDHDSNHDFSKDPIANIIRRRMDAHADQVAQSTTLGADNGMGA